MYNKRLLSRFDTSVYEVMSLPIKLIVLNMYQDDKTYIILLNHSIYADTFGQIYCWCKYLYFIKKLKLIIIYYILHKLRYGTISPICIQADLKESFVRSHDFFFFKYKSCEIIFAK